MKIAWFKKNISPEIGAYLAGYGLYDKSVAKADDLFATGLCVDDGERKVLLISFDLLGLDEIYIHDVRQKCAALLNVTPDAVMLTCTHTHTGPETRTLAKSPAQLNKPYLENLEHILCDAVTELKDYHECKAYFYSCQCDENRNRRYTSGDNRGTFTPYRREVVPGCTGFADKELGCLYFFDTKTNLPIYAIGNYAAHPLAGHAPGLGGRRISADFPGVFRDYITANTGAEAMYVSGALGDLVPKEDELGMDAVQCAGLHLAKEAIGGMVEASRNPLRYKLEDAKVGSSSQYFTVPLREKYKNNPERLPAPYLGKDDVTLEIQCLAIGDICFVGVPGELTTELGQEIKWHSPFRRTFIAYNATAYFSYIVPANFMVAGGYEALSQRFDARGGLKLVQTASDATFALREKLYPSQGEPYPNNCSNELVNILPNK